MVERQPWAQESTDTEMTVQLISSPESQYPQSVSNGREKQMWAQWWGG